MTSSQKPRTRSSIRSTILKTACAAYLVPSALLAFRYWSPDDGFGFRRFWPAWAMVAVAGTMIVLAVAIQTAKDMHASSCVKNNRDTDGVEQPDGPYSQDAAPSAAPEKRSS